MNSSSQRYHHGNEWQLLLEGLPKEAFFQDADKALEWCENKTISAAKTGEANIIHFEDCVLVKGMDTPQITVIQQYFQTVDYQAGNIVIEDGSPGDSLFLIASGTLDVLSRPDHAQQHSKSLRLHTFSSGSLVGEMSFIDNQARSARVVSRGDARCYLLDRKDYENLTKKHPELAIAIMSNISIVLSSRLRSANLTINHLSNQY
jgi:CRP-like cAMP-binding protein